MIELVLTASYVTQAVLILLLLLSIFSWAGIFYKLRVFSRANSASNKFLHEFKKGEDLFLLKKAALKYKESPLSALFLESIRRLQKKKILSNELEAEKDLGEELRATLGSLRRLLKTVSDEEITFLENYLSYFAIIGNVSPFIGLFGTVLGIIDAFQNISQIGSANIAAVAPGVAEALIATAAGLIAAIPAVIAYNYFLNSLRKINSRTEGFSQELIFYLEERLKTPKLPSRMSP
ncbi:MAG: MotA/TolQ/ExbB proton channel family protein [Nitrospirae bacterium]|nr:MotA/TolQ/ExbB proton channel family protein [Nitrospirota bacterium]